MKHFFTHLLTAAALCGLFGSNGTLAAPPSQGATYGKVTPKELFAAPQQNWRLMPKAADAVTPATGVKTASPRRKAGASASPVIYASMINNSSWGSSKAYGIYSFSPSEYAFTPLKQHFSFNAQGGASYIGDDNYLSVTLEDWSEWGMGIWVSLIAFDTNSWSQVYQSSGEETDIATDMAWCAADNKVYGCFNNDSGTGYVFGRFDSNTFVTSAIAPLDEAWIACGADASGNIFAVTRSGKLVSADRATGAVTEIGDTGLSSDNLTSGAIDPSTGVFYVATCNTAGSALYSVDTATAQASLLYEMANGEELVGMYVAVPALDPNVPAAVSDLAAEFAENSLEGTVSFTAPTTTVVGKTLGGELGYSVSTAEAEIASGTTTAGAAVEVPVALPEAGTYELTVTCSNASGAGASASVSVTVTSEKDPDNLVHLPYLEEFSTKEAFDGYTVINNNNDQWTYVYWANRGCALCQFNQYEASDDYLVTPPVRFEKGKIYVFSCDTYRREGPFTETFEIVMGSEPTAEKLTTVLQDTYTIADDATHTSTISIIPEKSGIYYIGIHCTSPINQYGLCVDNVRISAGSAAGAPATPQLNVVPDFGGATTAQVNVTAPTLDLSGEALGTLTSIVVLRDGEAVHTFENPAPGASIAYTDEPAEAGYHTYTAYAVNEFGDGRTTEQRVFVGINYPATPRNITIAETENLGEVTVAWDAPTTDCDGNVLNPELVTYMIAYRMSNGNLKIVDRGVKETTYTFRALDPETEPQRFVSYMIFSETAKGVNDWEITPTPSIPVGKPFETPYRETFGGETVTPILTGTSHYTDKWEISDMADDQDGDGFFLMYTGVSGSRGYVSTAKIHVAGENPTLSFWYMCVNDTEAVIEVSINDGTGFADIASVPLSRGNDMEWTNFSTLLSAYAGKDIQVKLSYSAKGYRLAIDNLAVFNPSPVDLETRGITVPMQVFPEVPFAVRLLVSNNGAQHSGAFTADLYRDGKIADQFTCDGIDAFGSTTISFEQTLSSMSAAVVSYYVVLNCEADVDKENNTSLTATVDLVQHDYPAATNLSATADGLNANLRWDAPVIDTTPVAVQDDLESYTAFSCGLPTSLLKDDNVGDWTLINADGGQCYLISIEGTPYYFPNAYAATSFVVLNAAKAGLPAHWGGHNESSQCFMAMASMGVRNDKWLISPLLSGREQIIKFFAKSLTDVYGLESFEVLYSTTGKEAADFVKVGEELANVPTDWTEYSYTIPAGAKYFAVRSISNDVYALLVDDFSFESAHPHSTLSLMGYNIYRDGAKISESPVAATEYVDVAPESNTYVYNVTALYNSGESTPSNAASITLSGIEGADAALVKVGTAAGCIVVENAGGRLVNVYGTDGRAYFNGIISEVARIHVAPGIYLVEIEGCTVKVSVK